MIDDPLSLAIKVTLDCAIVWGAYRLGRSRLRIAWLRRTGDVVMPWIGGVAFVGVSLLGASFIAALYDSLRSEWGRAIR